ncbi:MAG: hypothetical protein WBG71_09195 [Leeuwenhoekiella sp.]
MKNLLALCTFALFALSFSSCEPEEMYEAPGDFTDIQLTTGSGEETSKKDDEQTPDEW